MTRQRSMTAMKALIVLGALAFAGVRVGLWSNGSSTKPESDQLPARPPITLADLKPALDAEFAPVVQDGLLRQSTGCGVAIGVIDHGQRRAFTYGAARADSIFEIGSVTKTFTGLALAQLVAQKKVRLDEPLRPILFPDLAAGSPGTEITLLDLATHRSGFPSVPDNLKPKDSEQPICRLRPRRAASISCESWNRETRGCEVLVQQLRYRLARICARTALRRSLRATSPNRSHRTAPHERHRVRPFAGE